MRLKAMLLTFAIAALATAAVAQDAPKWSREDKADPMTDKQVVEYTLLGKFLSAPNGPHPAAPAIMLRCEPGSHDFGRFAGKLIDGFILLGSTIDATDDRDGQRGTLLAGEIFVEFRLDDQKAQHAYWGHSTDYSALTFSTVELDTLLYGHFMAHKRDTSPPVRKVLIEAPEFLGADVVAQFDMPDPDEVAETCGVLRMK